MLLIPSIQSALSSLKQVGLIIPGHFDRLAALNVIKKFDKIGTEIDSSRTVFLLSILVTSSRGSKCEQSCNCFFFPGRFSENFLGHKIALLQFSKQTNRWDLWNRNTIQLVSVLDGFQALKVIPLK